MLVWISPLTRYRGRKPDRDVPEADLRLMARQACKRCPASTVSDTITADQPTAEFLTRCCLRVPATRPMQGNEAPLLNRKAREVLGFEERHQWCDEVRALASAAG